MAYSQATTKPKLELDWSIWHGYTEAEVQKYAPLEAGIYVLAVRLKNSTNVRIFYVGQTANLDRRLKEHLADNETNTCLKNNVSKYICMFRYAKVSSQSNRDKAERALYERFRPSCNDSDAIPDVEDVEINF